MALESFVVRKLEKKLTIDEIAKHFCYDKESSDITIFKCARHSSKLKNPEVCYVCGFGSVKGFYASVGTSVNFILDNGIMHKSFGYVDVLMELNWNHNSGDISLNGKLVRSLSDRLTVYYMV